MRLKAYKKAIDEAYKIPTNINELSRYFKDVYNPRKAAIDYILNKARLDVDALFASEYRALYDYLIEKELNQKD